MRTILGILLLVVLSAPLVGTYAGLRIEKRRVKKEVKKRMIAGIDSTDLVFFAFSKYDSETLLRWEHAWEFEYQEQMYDVVKKQEQGDSLLLWCWWDHAETELNKQLRGLVAKTQAHDPRRHEKERRLVCFFLTLFLHEPPDQVGFPAEAEPLAGPVGSTFFCAAYFGAPPYPPPKDGCILLLRT